MTTFKTREPVTLLAVRAGDTYKFGDISPCYAHMKADGSLEISIDITVIKIRMNEQIDMSASEMANMHIVLCKPDSNRTVIISKRLDYSDGKGTASIGAGLKNYADEGLAQDGLLLVLRDSDSDLDTATIPITYVSGAALTCGADYIRSMAQTQDSISAWKQTAESIVATVEQLVGGRPSPDALKSIIEQTANAITLALYAPFEEEMLAQTSGDLNMNVSKYVKFKTGAVLLKGTERNQSVAVTLPKGDYADSEYVVLSLRAGDTIVATETIYPARYDMSSERTFVLNRNIPNIVDNVLTAALNAIYINNKTLKTLTYECHCTIPGGRMMTTGVDLRDGIIKLIADKVKFQTKDGTQIALFGEDGATINSQVLNVQDIVAKGIKAQTIDCEMATFKNMNVEGFVYKKLTIITQETYKQYLIKLRDGTGTWNGYMVNLDLTGSWIAIDKSTDFNSGNYPNQLTLPTLGFTEGRPGFNNYVRRYVGNTIMIYCEVGGKSLEVWGNFLKKGLTTNNITPFGHLTVHAGYFISATCRVGVNSDNGTEILYWEYEIGRYTGDIIERDANDDIVVRDEDGNII